MVIKRGVPAAVGLVILVLLVGSLVGCRPSSSPAGRVDEEPIVSRPDQVESGEQPDSLPMIDEDSLQDRIPIEGDVEFVWSGISLDDGVTELLQELFFRARFVTQVFEFGDLFAHVDHGDEVVVNDKHYYRVITVSHFGTYDRFVEFVRGTYTGDMPDVFLKSDRYRLVDGKLYSTDMSYGSTIVDTGLYSFDVLDVDDSHISVKLTVQRVTPDDRQLHDSVSEMEFRFVEGKWLIASQGFEP